MIEIVDCSKHLEKGGKKDASYIDSLFRPHLDQIEADYPNSVDMVYFDRASNVQKVGLVLGAKFPRIFVCMVPNTLFLFFLEMYLS
jgi:hypothetical protein